MLARKLLFAVTLSLFLLLPVNSVYAGDHDDCYNKCAAAETACFGQAEKHVNDIEVQNAKSACNADRVACEDHCANTDTEKYLEQQRLEQEKKDKVNLISPQNL